MNMWEGKPDTVVDTPDDTIAAKFHEAFAEPVSHTRWEAMRGL